MSDSYIQPNEKEWREQFKFFAPIEPRISETDLYGHLNNTSYLVYFEEARVKYFRTIDIFDMKIGIVAGDIYCRYHAEAFAFDELELGVRTRKIGTKSFILEYCLIRKTDDRLIASGWGTIVFLDHETKKTVVVPEILRKRISELEGKPF